MSLIEEDTTSILSVSAGGNGKLRQWLIEQIDSGKYPGLVWESDEKTVFRIPWKHAGKQDYNRDEDAALFKAWALFKGKHKEGVDKPDPPTWKTRLRCALNKSNDFVELVEKSQLDISDPYKVYKTITEGEKRGTGVKMSSTHETPTRVNALSYFSPYSTLLNQVPNYVASSQERYTQQPEQEPLPVTPHHHHAPHHGEMQYGHYPSLLNRPWHGPQVENGFQISGPFYAYSTEAQSASSMVDQSTALSDCSLHVSVFYRESLVKEVTTTSPQGCRITSASPSSPSSSSSSASSSPSPSSSSSSSSQEGVELHGGAEPILFPYPYPESQRQGADRLPAILERGVLLWMAHDGLYARRLCQGRVFWEGPLAPHAQRPNKLEKGHACKLIDTQQFLAELQDYIHHGRHVPRYQVTLCFGDEYPDPHRQRKMITVKVEPMFARKLVYYHLHHHQGQQTSGAFLRGYDHPEQDCCPSEEYPILQRPFLPVHD